MVRLAQQEVQLHVGEHLQKLVPMLSFNETVDVIDTLDGLLTKFGHLLTRLEIYTRYP